MEITKEGLQNEANRINEAVFKLKQSYSYSTDSKIIYVIVEGKDDICYYSSFLTNKLKNGWNAKFIKAKTRGKVVEAYKMIDWSKYSKNKVILIIDRDLSDFTGEETPKDINVYVTDKYSIENDLFNRISCESTLRSFFGLDDLDEKEMDILLKLYDNAFNKFKKNMLLIMSWILYWRKNGMTCNLNNLSIYKLFKIENGKLIKRKISNIDEYLNKSCGVQYRNIDLSPYIDEFTQNMGLDKFIRGKYIRSFFVMFIKSIHLSCGSILPGKTTKTHISLSDGNVLLILCGIMRAPESLFEFANSTYLDRYTYSS